MTTGWKLYWVLVAATLAVYFTMVFWSLPIIVNASGGLMPFDLRPTGYTFGDAQEFLATISPQGSEFYLETQHRLDTAYPGLLAAVLIIGLWWQSRILPLIVRAILVALPIVGGLADYMENAAVSKMLSAGASLATPEMVATASCWTMLKSATTGLAMVALLVLLFLALLRKRKNRAAAP